MSKAALSTREKYDRNARRYDLMEFFPESIFFGTWRKDLFSRITGASLLEVGVGTGKNLSYYPRGVPVTAIDFSEEMLKRARSRAAKLDVPADLRLMDAQSLEFPDDSFDAVVATFVFCSVPDPMAGLAEVKRVCKPRGHFYALEHVRPGGFLGGIFDRMAPFVENQSGVHINRNTVQNIRNAGFDLELERNLFLDIFKMIIARPAKGA